MSAHGEWSSALDDARGQVAGLSGSCLHDDDGHLGGITILARPPTRQRHAPLLRRGGVG